MNPEQNRLQCSACTATESSAIIHTLRKDFRLCTDCLLKEHRLLFCPFCFLVFDDDVPPPHGRILCGKCGSMTHLACSPPPSSSSSAVFTCPPCSDPNFSFFPKSHAQNGDNVNDVSRASIDMDTQSTKALAAAAKITVDCLNKEVALLKEDLLKKVVAAQVAKKKAHDALAILQEIVIKEKALENNNLPTKRKNDER